MSERDCWCDGVAEEGGCSNPEAVVGSLLRDAGGTDSVHTVVTLLEIGIAFSLRDFTASVANNKDINHEGVFWYKDNRKNPTSESLYMVTLWHYRRILSGLLTAWSEADQALTSVGRAHPRMTAWRAALDAYFKHSTAIDELLCFAGSERGGGVVKLLQRPEEMIVELVGRNRLSFQV